MTLAELSKKHGVHPNIDQHVEAGRTYENDSLM
jgi:hypothetical protein